MKHRMSWKFTLLQRRLWKMFQCQCHFILTNSPLYLVKLKMAQNGRPLTTVRSVEQIVPNFRRKSFSVPLVTFPACYKILSAVFWQKIFCILMGFYQKFIFKLDMVNSSMWTKVKLSWFATCYSYDVIKQLTAKLYCRVFISLSTGARIIKIDEEIREL